MGTHISEYNFKKVPRRVYISGPNEFLREYTIHQLLTRWKRTANYINDLSDLNSSSSSLFGEKKATIIPTRFSPDYYEDYTIKLAKSKLTKKYSDNGFIEINCNDLTERRAVKFAKKVTNVDFAPTQLSTICIANDNDAYSIYNALQLMDVVYSERPFLSNEELISYCGILINREEIKAIEFFATGQFGTFLLFLENIKSLTAFLIMMATVVNKAALGTETSFFYKNLSTNLAKLKCNPMWLASELTKLATNFDASREELLLKIQGIIFAL